MAKTAADLSVADLERMLSSRKASLESFLKKRAKLRTDLESIEKKIAQLEGRQSGAAKTRRVLKRPKNAKSLRTHVTEILGKNKKGLSLKDLNSKVAAAGYKSNSSNFSNVLYQCLYNADEFQHDEKTGRYVYTPKT